MKHTVGKRGRGQTAHTLAIVVIDAVFQDPMFALNAVASLNACGPSRTLAKSPRRISPEPRQSVQCMARASVQWVKCVRSDAVALDDLDAAQLRRLGGRNPERASPCCH